jgi:hypothetical protein
VDGDAVEVAEVHAVQVRLEDLLLVVVGLEGEGAHRLGRLAAQRARGAEVAVLDELLGDRAPALRDPSPPRVRERGPRDRASVDAGVLEEARVLGGEDGAPHVLGERGERHRNTPCTIGLERFGENLGLEPDVARIEGRRAAVGEPPCRDPAARPVEGEAEQLGRVVRSARAVRAPVEPERLVPPEVLARLVRTVAHAAVAEPLEPLGETDLAHAAAGRDGIRLGQDERVVPTEVVLEAPRVRAGERSEREDGEPEAPRAASRHGMASRRTVSTAERPR